MKQEERRLHTIRQLLDATKELIKEKGCQSITMKDIMDKSGLSKGAIFHYVRSKDEIFTWVLQERLEETNARFIKVVEQGNKTFEGPMQEIVNKLISLDQESDITNKILPYLIGRENEPAIAEVLKQYYERSVFLSREWIVSGQRHGVISLSVEADQTAEMFVLLSLGLRIRSSFPVSSSNFIPQDFISFIIRILNPDGGE